jgi:hypothetical protein
MTREQQIRLAALQTALQHQGWVVSAHKGDVLAAAKQIASYVEGG